MGDPLVSIIVPAYNAGAYIEDGLLSLVNQTWSALEIIVIDDGSSDDTAAIVERLCRSHDRIKLYQKENGGVSSARNLGIALAQGEYIAFQDADDLSHPDRIEKQLTFLRDKGLALCGCSLSIFGRRPKEKHYPEKDGELKANLLFFGRTIPGPTVMYRKACAEGMLFNESIAYGEDLDFIMRTAFKDGNKIGNLCEPLYQYRQHGEQATERLKQTNRVNMIRIMSEVLNGEGVVVSDAILGKHFDFCKESDSDEDISDEDMLAFYRSLIAFLELKGGDLWYVREQIYRMLKKNSYSGSRSNEHYRTLKAYLPYWQRGLLSLRFRR